MSNWEKWTKRYVWDDDKTPFLVPVNKLTKLQARKELFLYIMFVGTPIGLLGFVSLAAITRQESIGYFLFLVYAVSILASLYLLHSAKSQYAAFYSATAPLVLFLHLIVNGFPSKLHAVEQGLLLVFLLLWLRYTFRIVRMAKRFPEMREGVMLPPTL